MVTDTTIVDETLARRMHLAFQANAQPLYGYLLKLTHGQRELAEDLLQETMLRAWNKLAELPTDASVIRRWLFIVARHLVIDRVRARQSRPAEICTEDISWARSTDDAFDGLMDSFTVRDALRRLTPEHRRVLVELYYSDASVAEVASRIGIPPGTVRSRSFYALRAARGLLSEVDTAA
jgi:RNA polymerase sigma-70 factor (ECF subfamily)